MNPDDQNPKKESSKTPLENLKDILAKEDALAQANTSFQNPLNLVLQEKSGIAPHPTVQGFENGGTGSPSVKNISVSEEQAPDSTQNFLPEHMRKLEELLKAYQKKRALP